MSVPRIGFNYPCILGGRTEVEGAVAFVPLTDRFAPGCASPWARRLPLPPLFISTSPPHLSPRTTTQTAISVADPLRPALNLARQNEKSVAAMRTCGGGCGAGCGRGRQLQVEGCHGPTNRSITKEIGPRT